MPNNGLVVAWDALELRCAGSISGSGSGAGYSTYSYGATATTSWAPNAIDEAPGIYLHCESSFDGISGSWQVVYDGPGAPFGGYVVSGSGFQATSISAVIRDLVIYQKLTGALWRVTWSAIDIYVNGSFDITLPGSSVDMTSEGVGPNYIPILGVPLDLTGGCSAGRDGIPGWEWNPCSPSEGVSGQNYTTQASGAVEGGWRFKERGSGEWQELPCTPYYLDSPSTGGTCPFGLSAAGIVEASSTWDAAVNVESYTEHEFTYEGRDECTYLVLVCCTQEDDGGEEECVVYEAPGAHCIDPCLGFPNMVEPFSDVYKTRHRTRSKGGRIRLVPDLAKAIRRHREGYRALWLRLPLPQVTASASRTCTVDSVTTSGTSNPEVYPQSDEFLGAVGDEQHVMEEFFDLPTYAPTSASKSEAETIGYSTYGPGVCDCGDFNNVGPGMCPNGYGVGCGTECPEYENSSQSESVGYSFVATIGDEGSYQWHFVPELRYLSTWASLHWHYLHWHEDWSFDEAGLTYLDYWGYLRQQWIYNDFLPAEEKRRTRSDMIGSCHEESGHTPFMDAFMGGYRWLGCSRWKVRRPEVPSELATDAAGADRWTFGNLVDGEWDGEGSVGSVITLEPGTTRATVEVLDFNSVPYLYALICDRVRIGTATNAASIKVTAIGADGATATVCTSSGTWPLPSARSKKYAGSWAIDNGMLVVSDTGTDEIPGKGVSPETMSDAERVVGFELLPTRSPARLRFDVVPVDPEEPVTIQHPVFLRDESVPTMVWESGQVCTLLYPDGGMLRLGNWVWYVPGFGLLNPPLVTGAGYKSTIIDALCTQRVIWEGRAHDDGLTTELTELYDSYEGQSVAVVDKFSVTWPLPGEAPNLYLASAPWALVNTMAEGPPLCCFPNKSWNAATWEQTGPYKLEVWDWAQEPRYLITSGSERAHLLSPSDVQWTSDYADVPSGWRASVHSHAVDNLEAPNYKVVKGGKVWAHVTPWRGYASVLFHGQEGGKVSYDVARHARHYGGYVNSNDKAVILRSPNAEHTNFSEVVSDIDCTSLCVRVERASPSQKTLLMYAADDGVHVVVSGDDGETWSVPTTISSTGACPAFVLSNSGTRFYYWLEEDGDTFTIKGQIRDALDSVIEATFTVKAGVEGVGLAADESVGADGLHRVTLLYVEDGELSSSVSYNGKDFS